MFGVFEMKNSVKTGLKNTDFGLNSLTQVL